MENFSLLFMALVRRDAKFLVLLGGEKKKILKPLIARSSKIQVCKGGKSKQISSIVYRTPKIPFRENKRKKK